MILYQEYFRKPLLFVYVYKKGYYQKSVLAQLIHFLTWFIGDFYYVLAINKFPIPYKKTWFTIYYRRSLRFTVYY